MRSSATLTSQEYGDELLRGSRAARSGLALNPRETAAFIEGYAYTKRDAFLMRRLELAKLAPAIEAEILFDGSHAARTLIVSAIEDACRAERKRGLAGHWTYDLARHDQMFSILKAERAELVTLPQAVAA